MFIPPTELPSNVENRDDTERECVHFIMHELLCFP